MRSKTITVRINKRVRQALGRRGIYVNEYDELTGELSKDPDGFRLYLPDCDLNVFLRRSHSEGISFNAIGTGQSTAVITCLTV
jgi:hypothetical protein